jgi:hypothetical protein
MQGHETKRDSSDKSNLAGISGDHEYANVIALGISGKHEKTDSIRVISDWSSDNLLSIGESHFDCPAVLGCVRKQEIMVFADATELPHKENRFEVPQLDLYSGPVKGVILGKQIERVLRCRKLADVALDAVPI